MVEIAPFSIAFNEPYRRFFCLKQFVFCAEKTYICSLFLFLTNLKLFYQCLRSHREQNQTVNRDPLLSKKVNRERKCFVAVLL